MTQALAKQERDLAHPIDGDAGSGGGSLGSSSNTQACNVPHVVVCRPRAHFVGVLGHVEGGLCASTRLGDNERCSDVQRG